MKFGNFNSVEAFLELYSMARRLEEFAEGYNLDGKHEDDRTKMMIKRG